MNLRPHTIGHEVLRLRVDHAILFGDQEPRWSCFPHRRRRRLLNALNRDWPLHGSCNACLFRRSLVGNCLAKATVRNPYKAVRIGSQLGRFRRLWITIENLSYSAGEGVVGILVVGRCADTNYSRWSQTAPKLLS